MNFCQFWNRWMRKIAPEYESKRVNKSRILLFPLLLSFILVNKWWSKIKAFLSGLLVGAGGISVIIIILELPKILKEVKEVSLPDILMFGFLSILLSGVYIIFNILFNSYSYRLKIVEFINKHLISQCPLAKPSFCKFFSRTSTSVSYSCRNQHVPTKYKFSESITLEECYYQPICVFMEET